MLVFVVIDINHWLNLKTGNPWIMKIYFAQNALLAAIFLQLRWRNSAFHLACLSALNMIVMIAKLFIFSVRVWYFWLWHSSLCSWFRRVGYESQVLRVVSGKGRETMRSLLKSPGENWWSLPNAGEDRAEVPGPASSGLELTGGDFDFLERIIVISCHCCKCQLSTC